MEHYSIRQVLSIKSKKKKYHLTLNSFYLVSEAIPTAYKWHFNRNHIISHMMFHGFYSAIAICVRTYTFSSIYAYNNNSQHQPDKR